MMKFALVASGALVGGLLACTSAMAFTGPVDFTEGVDGAFEGGSVVAIPTAVPPISVASDGEVTFEPFGSTFDVSDAIQFSAGSGWEWSGPANSWEALNATTWVLPAVTSCGSENGNHCEDLGHWLLPGTAWNASTPSEVVFLESGGGISDRIALFNNGAGANILFSSDPSVIPEPATWAMMLIGFAGLGFAGYRARAKIAPAT